MEGGLKNPTFVCVYVYACVCACVEEQQGIKMPPALQSEPPSSGLWPRKALSPCSALSPLADRVLGGPASIGVAPEQQNSGKRDCRASCFLV